VTELGGAAESGAAGGVAAKRWILGLGNPGARYAATRHNVGFRFVEELARRRGTRLLDLPADEQARHLECNALVADDDTLGLAAPQTYMNRSGHAARCLTERRGLAPEDFLVVYDEIHLALGTLRLRRSGSPAGHRGMESVLESLGTDRVPRLRLGVGGDDGSPVGEDLVEFVLQPFAADELKRAEAMILRAADACEAWAADGVDAAMQRFNGPSPVD
jgi:peptidyl-tRNA hydrolase, PTH1 family